MIGTAAARRGDCGSSLAAAAGLGISASTASLFVALCSTLPCAQAIASECARSLGVTERSSAALAEGLLHRVRSAGRDCTSASALLLSIRHESRDDFKRGEIMTVDGWILSRTEIEVYALSALLRHAPVNAPKSS